jgi:hypothetical protein
VLLDVKYISCAVSVVEVLAVDVAHKIKNLTELLLFLLNIMLSNIFLLGKNLSYIKFCVKFGPRSSTILLHSHVCNRFTKIFHTLFV